MYLSTSPRTTRVKRIVPAQVIRVQPTGMSHPFFSCSITSSITFPRQPITGLPQDIASLGTCIPSPRSGWAIRIPDPSLLRSGCAVRQTETAAQCASRAPALQTGSDPNLPPMMRHRSGKRGFEISECSQNQFVALLRSKFPTMRISGSNGPTSAGFGEKRLGFTPLYTMALQVCAGVPVFGTGD